MKLDTIANVSITRTSRTISRRSYGTVLLAGYHAEFLDRVRTYSDPADMIADGFSETDPLYLAAVSLMSQSPRPENFKIGRRVGAPTQTIQITPSDIEVGWVYTITIGGETASYTVVALDTITEVLAGLKAAVNALTAAVTADDASGTYLEVAADVAGTWFAYTAPDARSSIEDVTAEPGTTLATDLAAIDAEDANWYAFDVVDAQSQDQIVAAATWAETQTKVYFPHIIDTAVVTTATDDTASVLKTASRLRTAPFYSRVNHGHFPNLAMLGAVLPQDPGSSDFEFKTLSGCAADSLTETELGYLLGTASSPASGKCCSCYVEVIPEGVNSGTSVTQGGLVSGGEWIDIVIGLDFAASEMQSRSFDARISMKKVPFTSAGIDIFAGAVRGALNLAASTRYKIFDPDSITVSPTAIEDVSAADKAARYYNGVAFDAQTQGSIRRWKFTGTVRP